MANVMSVFSKQVDILISKNQVWQILYLKHCVYKTTYRIAGKFGGGKFGESILFEPLAKEGLAN